MLSVAAVNDGPKRIGAAMTISGTMVGVSSLFSHQCLPLSSHTLLSSLPFVPFPQRLVVYPSASRGCRAGARFKIVAGEVRFSHPITLCLLPEWQYKDTPHIYARFLCKSLSWPRICHGHLGGISIMQAAAFRHAHAGGELLFPIPR